MKRKSSRRVRIFHKRVPLDVDITRGSIFHKGRLLPVTVRNGQPQIAVPRRGAAAVHRLVARAAGLVVPRGYLVHHKKGPEYNGVEDLAVVHRRAHRALHRLLASPWCISVRVLARTQRHFHILDHVPSTTAVVVINLLIRKLHIRNMER